MIGPFRRPSRPAIVHLALGAFAVLLVFRSAYLQLWRGGDLSAVASKRYFQIDTVVAPRGDILDEVGRHLVQGFERASLSIAPNQVRKKADRTALRTALIKLGVSSAELRKALDTNVRWLQLPYRYMPAQLASIRSLRGVFPEAIVSRQNFASAGVRALIGRVGKEGRPEGGLERILDEQLRGEPGLITRVNDPRGRPDVEVPVAVLRETTRGNSVTLTINKALQGIAENALSDAVNSRSAQRGDIVIIQPATGEIRAMASYSPELGFASSDMIAEPFEPGSSIKPLLVSRLLELRRAKTDEVMVTGSELQIPGRPSPIKDDHGAPTRTLHETIVFSSNIGMVKFTERLSGQEQFEAYRDFGLGMPTGISLPSEAAGILPSKWGQLEKAATSFGYSMSVTSLQLAMAYSTFANGGELLEPTLVKEIRSPSGDLIFRHAPRVVRRVMSPSTAAQMRVMLRDVVVSGTAQSAEISLGELAGKTGTAWLYDGVHGYDGKYTATFAGMFPARDPQFVIVVRIVDPAGAMYYGGQTAAPVMAGVLKAAAVAQGAALDAGSLVSASHAVALSPESSGDPDAARDADDGDNPKVITPEAPERNYKRVIVLDQSARTRSAERSARPVPRVDGLALRDAVYVLHQAGFKVRLKNASEGPEGSTYPVAGSVRKPGELVLLYRSQ